MRLVLVLVGLSVLVCLCSAAKGNESRKTSKSRKALNPSATGKLKKKGSFSSAVANRLGKVRSKVWGEKEDPTEGRLIYIHGEDQGGPDLCAGTFGENGFELTNTFKNSQRPSRGAEESTRSSKPEKPDPVVQDFECRCGLHCSRVFGYHFQSPDKEFNFAEGLVIPLTKGSLKQTSDTDASSSKSKKDRRTFSCGCDTTKEFADFLKDLNIALTDFENEKISDTDSAIEHVYKSINEAWEAGAGGKFIQHMTHDKLLQSISDEMEAHNCISNEDPLRAQAELNACIRQEWGWSDPKTVSSFTRIVMASTPQ